MPAFRLHPGYAKFPGHARVKAALYRVCIEEPPLETKRPSEVAALRHGLNAIARLAR